MIYGAVTALVLLIAAFWLGADWIGAKKYQDGFAAGQIDERSKAEEQMKTVTAQLQAEGLALQAKESAIARERNRIQDAAREVARVTQAEELGDARLELARVIQRVRSVEAASRDTLRRANRPDRVPEAPGAACGPEGATSTGLLSPGNGEALLRLSSEADIVSAQYRLCLSQFYKPPVSKQ